MTAMCRREPDGVAVAVRVTPRARRAAVGGTAPGGARLRIAVTEPPEEGRATRAACAALAAALGVAPSRVGLRAGAGAREKILHVAGDSAILAARLESLREA